MRFTSLTDFWLLQPGILRILAPGTIGARIAVVLAALVLISLTGSSEVEWVWSGAVTPTSAVVKAKVGSDTNQVRLELSPKGPDTRPVERLEKPDANGVVAFELKDLSPDTLYHYSVAAREADSLSGQFRTFTEKAMSFQIAFGSCAKTGSNHEVWSAIKNMDPLFFIHMGDFHYENISVNKPERFRQAFDRCLLSPRQSALYRHTPIAYVWDDHDFGANDADGTSPSRPAALKTYQEYVPHYPLTRVGGRVETIQQAFSVGRIRFILTDLRSRRSPQDTPDGPEKSMLGQHQRAWLLQEFERASEQYALVVWVNVVPWITKNAQGSGHGWEPYSYERTLIANHIKALGLVNRFLILSGDGHMVAIDDGTNSNYASTQTPGEGAFPVIQAAPIHRYPRVKGGPYSHGTYVRKRLFGLIQATQFGFMRVDDDGRTLEIRLSGRDSKGALLDNMQLKIHCEDGACRTF